MSESTPNGWAAREPARNGASRPDFPASAPERRGIVMVGAPLVCLLLALLLGLGLGVISALPGRSPLVPFMQVLRPLHTLASIGCVLTGIVALFIFTAQDIGARGVRPLRWIMSILIVLFFPLAAGSVIVGAGSGKEYLTWAPILTPLLVLMFVILAAFFFANIRRFTRLSPEGAWLIGVGLVCIPLGLIEASAYLLPFIGFEKEISFDWHGLDIFFAGWNAALYGFGIVIAGGKAKPLRAPWLFLLAAFGFASTFGHHHYLSPQPQLIKYIAFAASMLAAVSFVRHMRSVAHIKSVGSRAGPAGPFLVAAELWTLVAVASGITLAIPQVNLVLHGTPAIVGHSMTAMIGVNVVLVLGGLAFFLRTGIDEARARRMKYSVRWLTVALALFWIDLTVAGVVKGVLRFDNPYAVHHLATVRALYPLPILGLLVAIPLVLICWDLFRCAMVQGSRSSPASTDF